MIRITDNYKENYDTLCLLKDQCDIILTDRDENEEMTIVEIRQYLETKEIINTLQSILAIQMYHVYDQFIAYLADKQQKEKEDDRFN